MAGRRRTTHHLLAAGRRRVREIEVVRAAVVQGVDVVTTHRQTERFRVGLVVVFGGGIIPEEDLPALYDAGIAAVFAPGTPLDVIETWVAENLSDR